MVSERNERAKAFICSTFFVHQRKRVTSKMELGLPECIIIAIVLMIVGLLVCRFFKINIIPKELRLKPPAEKFKLPKMDRDIKGKWKPLRKATGLAAEAAPDPDPAEEP